MLAFNSPESNDFLEEGLDGIDPLNGSSGNNVLVGGASKDLLVDGEGATTSVADYLIPTLSSGSELATQEAIAIVSSSLGSEVTKAIDNLISDPTNESFLVDGDKNNLTPSLNQRVPLPL